MAKSRSSGARTANTGNMAKGTSGGSAAAYALSGGGKSSPVTLQGSEKQVRWAETIRSEKIAQVKSALEQAKNFSPEVRETIIRALNETQEASYWIDNRSNKATNIMVDRYLTKAKPVAVKPESMERTATLNMGFRDIKVFPGNKMKQVQIGLKDGKQYLIETEIGVVQYDKTHSFSGGAKKVYRWR